MANKDIKIGFSFDSSGIDAALRNIEAKMNRMNKTSSMMSNIRDGGGTLSDSAQRNQKVFDESSARVRQVMARDLAATIKIEEAHRDKNIASQIKLNKLVQEGAESQRKNLEAIDRKIMDQSSGIAQYNKSLNDLTGGGGTGDGKPPATQAGGLGGFLSKIMDNMSPMKIAAAMAGSAVVLGQFMSHRATREREYEGAQGRTTKAGNLEFYDTMRGQGFMKHYEEKERDKAMSMAMKEREGRLSADPVSAVGSVLMKILGGAGVGALAGGAAGFGFGAIPGAIIGGVGAAGSAILGDKGVYNQIFDRDAYKANLNASTMENYHTNIANQRMQDPGKYSAAEHFGQKAAQMQQMQRRLGLTDSELFGGGAEQYKETSRRTPLKDVELSAQDLEDVKNNVGDIRANQISKRDGGWYGPESKRSQEAREASENRVATDEINDGKEESFMIRQMKDRNKERSFSDERIQRNMADIFAARGSSEFIKGGGASQAAEFQRGGFLGAASEMGGISGLGKDSKQTENAYLRLLSEGVRLGFNASKPSEEMRKFTEIASAMYTRSGGDGPAVGILGSAMTGTMAGMQAGQETFARANAEAGDMTGIRSSLKQHYMQSSEGMGDFKGLNARMKQAMIGFDLENLTEDHPTIIGAVAQFNKANGTNITAKEMIAKARKPQEFSSTLSPQAQAAKDKNLANYKKFLGGKPGTNITKQEFQDTEEGKIEGTDASNYYKQERGMGQLSATGEKSLRNFMLGPNADGTNVNIDAIGKGGKVDNKEKADATDDTAKMLVIANSIDKLANSYETYAKSSDSTLVNILKAMDMESFIAKLAEKNQAAGNAALSNYNTLFPITPTSQPTTGNTTPKK